MGRTWEKILLPESRKRRLRFETKNKSGSNPLSKEIKKKPKDPTPKRNIILRKIDTLSFKEFLRRYPDVKK